MNGTAARGDAHEALGAAMVVMEFSTRHDKGLVAEAGRLGSVVEEPAKELEIIAEPTP